MQTPVLPVPAVLPVRRALATMALAAGLAGFAAPLAAQQVITLSVAGTATGLDLWNNRSVTRVKAGDAPG